MAPPAALVQPEEARLGEEILVVGFPWGRRLGLFSGIVSQVPLPEEEGDGARGEGGEQGIMVDAVAVSGVSGGSVFRSFLRAAGIPSAASGRGNIEER